MTVLQPFEIVDDRDDLGLNAVVIATDHPVLADFAIHEPRISC
jgi:hypothetical protein